MLIMALRAAAAIDQLRSMDERHAVGRRSNAVAQPAFLHSSSLFG
jgi:hypothetical protein